MLESKQFICLLLVVSILRTKDTYGAHQRRAHTNRTVDVKDKIIEFQCIAKCFKTSPENRQECERKCRIEMTKAPRPGKCPSLTLSNHIGTCIDTCQYDFDCSETHKCCPSTCGPVCQDAIGLDKEQSLPSIPKIIAFVLPKGQKVCEVKIQASDNSAYVYDVETRHHIGSLFSERKLSSWQCQAFEKIADETENKTKSTRISFKLKPGRWYQFRVAAINANGFRGYTEPSKQFTLSNHNIRADPKSPRMPSDVRVLSTKFHANGLLSIKVGWCPSKSDLPLEKYKVTWAKHIPSNSLILNETYVKDVTQIEIPRLSLNAFYYIQVQAISISGSHRLKSDKAGRFFNSTLPLVQDEKLRCSGHRSSKEIITNVANNMLEDHATIPIRNISNYDVKFRPSRKFGMIVQISGFRPQKGRLIEICAGDFSNCTNREYGAIRPKKDFIEFGRLKFDTKYTIRTLDPSSSGKRSDNDMNSSTAQFTTPNCENWHKRFPKIQITC